VAVTQMRDNLLWQAERTQKQAKQWEDVAAGLLATAAYYRRCGRGAVVIVDCEMNAEIYKQAARSMREAAAWWTEASKNLDTTSAAETAKTAEYYAQLHMERLHGFGGI
jgi:hypothetical protein